MDGGGLRSKVTKFRNSVFQIIIQFLKMDGNSIKLCRLTSHIVRQWVHVYYKPLLNDVLFQKKSSSPSAPTP